MHANSLGNDNFLDSRPGNADNSLQDISYSWREAEQLSQEVTLVTQKRYTLRKKEARALDGLDDTILNLAFDTSDTMQTTANSSITDSLESVGPFGTVPLVDQYYSSDSSYNQSRRRDIAFSYDSSSSGTGLSATPEGYQESRRQLQMDRMDALIAHLGNMNEGLNPGGIDGL